MYLFDALLAWPDALGLRPFELSLFGIQRATLQNWPEKLYDNITIYIYIGTFHVLETYVLCCPC